MFWKKGKKFLSSFASRLTLKYSLLFAIILILVYFVSDCLLSAGLLKEVDEHMAEEASEIAYLYEFRDLNHVRDEIVMEILEDGPKEVFFRFLPANGGEVIHSPLEHWAGFDFDKLIPLGPPRGQSRFIFIPEGSSEAKTIRVILKKLNDGSLIQIGTSLSEYYALKWRIRKIFWVSVILLMVAGTILGWLNSHQAMKGVRRVTRTALSISKGDFHKRVDLGNEGDEIEELGKVFNEMIAKIQNLVCEMKDVTNSIAHDLRSPITRMRGIAETTRIGREDIQEYRLMAEMVVEECDRLESMISTLLEIAQADAGLNSGAFQSIDIAQTVKSGCELFEPMMEDKGIAFRLSLPERPVMLKTDNSRIQRVIANLLDNAIKFTCEKGTISLGLSDHPNYIEIRIQDTGIGIDKKDIGRIFEPFYRADQSRTSVGNGLGLSLVKSMVHSLNGEISVQSTLGEGSTFTVILRKDPSAPGAA